MNFVLSWSLIQLASTYTLVWKKYFEICKRALLDIFTKSFDFQLKASCDECG